MLKHPRSLLKYFHLLRNNRHCSRRRVIWIPLKNRNSLNSFKQSHYRKTRNTYYALTDKSESSQPTSAISPNSPTELQTLPIEITSSNGLSHINTDIPLPSPSTPPSAKETLTSLNQPISTSPQPKRTFPEKPHI